MSWFPPSRRTGTTGPADLPAKPQAAKPGKFSFCPFCGHALADDMTAEQKFGVQVAICPPERLRITWNEFAGVLYLEKMQ